MDSTAMSEGVLNGNSQSRGAWGCCILPVDEVAEEEACSVQTQKQKGRALPSMVL